MTQATHHRNRDHTQAALCRIARVACGLTEAPAAQLCVHEGDLETVFHANGSVETHSLGDTREVERTQGCTVLLRDDDGVRGRHVAVPVCVHGGPPLGALMLEVPSSVQLTLKLCAVLEELAALAGLLARRWIEASGSGVTDLRPSSQPSMVHTDDILWETDANLRFTHFSSVTGVSADWMIGRVATGIKAFANEPEVWAQHLADLAARRPYQDLCFDTERDGRPIRISTSGYPVFAADGTFAGYRGLSREFEPILRQPLTPSTPRFDPVTGLMNRTSWYQCMRRLLPGDQAHTVNCALFLIDVDHFKTFNQRLGFSVADDVLRAIARRLEGVVRVQDQLARIGSDEFAIIAGDVPDPRSAEDLAERLGEAFMLPVYVGDESLEVSVTMGIALAPQDGATADELIASAGLAQACAKAECRGRYRLYALNMRDQLRDRVVLDNDLQKAVAAHELELFYQPQVRLSDTKVVGAEALLRWRHPERGMLAPAQFIEALEQSGYAVSVGNWVVQEAARRCRAWHDAGFPIRVGVNLSAAHFASLDIVDLVRETLDETALDPSFLELEVTENVFLRSGQDGRTLIARLRGMGVRVSFDDFGTGYGSLSDLRSIPVDRIKIDRMFIKDSLSSANDASIVRAIISLARNLGLETVAEGVEDEAQEALLRLFGCDEVQGYLYSKPVPAGAFETLLRDNARQEAEDRMEAARDRAREGVLPSDGARVAA